MTAKDIDRFVDDCRFAKIVDTADGPAIRIGSDIINVRSSNPHLHVEGLTRALRRALFSQEIGTTPQGDSSQWKRETEDRLSTPPVQ